MGDFNQVAIPGATYARKYQKYKCIVMDVEIHICMSGGTHAFKYRAFYFFSVTYNVRFYSIYDKKFIGEV